MIHNLQNFIQSKQIQELFLFTKNLKIITIRNFKDLS